LTLPEYYSYKEIILFWVNQNNHIGKREKKMKKSHMSFVVFMFSLFFFCNSLSFAANDDWTYINGTVSYNGTPVCAMVLANGQYMFSCEENQGTYELEIPLDENGEIILFALVDGLAPFKQILTPWEALDFDIEMQLASPDSKTPTVTSTVVESIDNPGWVEIEGFVSLEGTPLCAMVLANGQYMFSCDPNGEYQLSVPLDPKGEITLFTFVDGLQPYKEIISFNEDTDATLEVINNFHIAQDISLDNRFIGTVQPNTTGYFQISTGRHTVKACDQEFGCVYDSFDAREGETVTYTIASSLSQGAEMPFSSTSNHLNTFTKKVGSVLIQQ
jgi:hypothetical protein